MNNFLPFNVNQTNQMPQGQYQTAGQRLNGVTGIAISELHNKLFRQTSVAAAAMGEFVSRAGLTADDTDHLVFAQNFIDALTLNFPNASETQWGIIGLARTVDMAAGTDHTRAITPLMLRNNPNIIPRATTTQVGITQLATNAQAIAGTDETVALTPANLSSIAGNFVPQATTVIVGRTRYATNAEAIAGIEPSAAITPPSLQAAMTARFPQFTTTIIGVGRGSTTAEVQSGTRADVIVTPLSLSQGIASILPVATTVIQGIIRIATATEVIAGTSNNTVVTPATLSGIVTQFTESVLGIGRGATSTEGAAGTSNSLIMTPLRVQERVAPLAPINSPQFTGLPTTLGTFRNMWIDSPLNAGQSPGTGHIRNIFITLGGPPPNSIGMDGDMAFRRVG